jgi:hypothetical protein
MIARQSAGNILHKEIVPMMADSNHTHNCLFNIATQLILMLLMILLPACSHGIPTQARPPAANLYESTRLPWHDTDTKDHANTLFVSIAGIRAGKDYGSVSK